MLHMTPPLALTPDAVWVFVTSEDGPAVDAARLAHIPGSSTFAALPVEVFTTSGLFPACASTGEYVTGFRWATAADIDAHAHLFTESPKE